MVSASPLDVGRAGAHRAARRASRHDRSRERGGRRNNMLAKLMQEIQKPGIYARVLRGSGTGPGGSRSGRRANRRKPASHSAQASTFRTRMRNIWKAGSVPNLKWPGGRPRRRDSIAIRFRLDKSLPQGHRQLDANSPATRAPPASSTRSGRIGQSALPNPKLPPQPAAPLTARTKLPVLQPGAYRVRLEGEDADGQTARIDERTYWFDGKDLRGTLGQSLAPAHHDFQRKLPQGHRRGRERRRNRQGRDAGPLARRLRAGRHDGDQATAARCADRRWATRARSR